jgi:hypothetical protein
MPNTQNFKSDIENLQAQYIRFTVSRVIENIQNDLLEMEVPAEFSTTILENNIEINIYSLADNSLIFSDVIRASSEAITTERLQYKDNSYRTLLYIDFAKIPEIQLQQGTYSVTLNFFADEVGSYDNRILKVNKISTSRTEVELKLDNISLQQKLIQFATPRISTEYILPALKQIFNQENADQLTLPMSSVKVDSASIYRNFTSGSGEKLIQYRFNEDDGSRIGVSTIAQNVLNIAYPLAKTRIEQYIAASASIGLTETELTNYVIDAIDIAYDSALSDESVNPQNYRFDLI